METETDLDNYKKYKEICKTCKYHKTGLTENFETTHFCDLNICGVHFMRSCYDRLIEEVNGCDYYKPSLLKKIKNILNKL